MIIRKLFKFEGSHVVRNCTSQRCRESIHGHSYKVELLIESNKLDDGQMVLDFGILKTVVKDFIDGFDHTHVMWEKDKKEVLDFFKKENQRWIELPVSPSAEMLSIVIYYVVQTILAQTVFSNGEEGIHLHSVIVHETATGYAQCFKQDVMNHYVMKGYGLEDIKFSPEILKEWKYPTLFSYLINGRKIYNPKNI